MTFKTVSAAALCAALLSFSSAAMAAEPTAAPAAEAPAAEAAPAEAAPEAAAPAEAAPAAEAAAETPAAPAAAVELNAAAFALNSPVVGSDGKDVGTINRVSSAANGAVTELQVKTGAGVVIVPASAIAAGGDKVQLSVTADEAAKFPAVESNG